MKVGVSAPMTDLGIRVDDFARAVEERGFDSLWIGEHTHIPVSVASQPKDGRPFREYLKRMGDPFVQLGMAAGVTKTLKLATGICLIAQHDPITLAKTVATLDFISGGRFTLGAGYGWNEIEARHHGIEWKDRRPIFREKLQAMRGLWEREVAEFSGTYVAFEPSYAWPKPVQKRVPVLIGAQLGPQTISDIVNLAEGWLPMTVRGGDEKLPADLEMLKRAWAEAGRPADELIVTLNEPTLYHSFKLGEDFKAQLEALPGKRVAEENGLDGLVAGIPTFDRDSTLKLLDIAAKYYFG